MMPGYDMDMVGTLHGYCRDTDFTHKRKVLDTIQHNVLPLAYFGVSVYHRLLMQFDFNYLRLGSLRII